MAQDRGNSDSANEFLYLMIGIVLFCFIFWMLFRNLIIGLYLKLWTLESYVAQFFDSEFSKVPAWAASIEVKKLTFGQFIQAASIMGGMTNFFTATVLGGLAYYVYKKSPHEFLMKQHSTQSLLKVAVKEWPQISPIIGLDLLKSDEQKIKAMDKEFEAARKEGREPVYPSPKGFDQALGEWEFARVHKLVNKDGILDETKANLIMINQLGPLFTSPLAMAKHKRVMFALFMLRIDRKNKEYRDLMGRMALSFNNKDFTIFNEHVTIEEIDNIIRGYLNHKWLKRLTAQYAYQNTLLVGLLNQARIESGVLPSADFIWLRPVDRVLWYALNGEGRRVGWAESAGVKAHWLAEVSVRRKLETPVIVEAVNALRTALIETPEITGEE